MKRTEREKMLAGEPYDCGDPALIARWHQAKDLLRHYAQIDTRDRAALTAVLEQLLGSQGGNVWIVAPFFCDYGDNIHIGANTEINANCVFLDCNRITLGANGLIGPAVQIYTAFHPLRAAERLQQQGHDDNQMLFCKTQALPVTIGDNVWIGGGSIIMPGVTIGDNVTVGAGSLVTRDIPANTLAMGSPARVVRAL